MRTVNLSVEELVIIILYGTDFSTFPLLLNITELLSSSYYN